ncbi:MAG: hypothetical protein JJU02_16360 [Cryomorphaceae bacterium]|nr:hypothetical protein [Cryomorphaceae bacterium]
MRLFFFLLILITHSALSPALSGQSLFEKERREPNTLWLEVNGGVAGNFLMRDFNMAMEAFGNHQDRFNSTSFSRGFDLMAALKSIPGVRFGFGIHQSDINTHNRIGQYRLSGVDFNLAYDLDLNHSFAIRFSLAYSIMTNRFMVQDGPANFVNNNFHGVLNNSNTAIFFSHFEAITPGVKGYYYFPSQKKNFDQFLTLGMRFVLPRTKGIDPWRSFRTPIDDGPRITQRPIFFLLGYGLSF